MSAGKAELFKKLYPGKIGGNGSFETPRSIGNSNNQGGVGLQFDPSFTGSSSYQDGYNNSNNSNSNNSSNGQNRLNANENTPFGNSYNGGGIGSMQNFQNDEDQSIEDINDGTESEAADGGTVAVEGIVIYDPNIFDVPNSFAAFDQQDLVLKMLDGQRLVLRPSETISHETIQSFHEKISKLVVTYIRGEDLNPAEFETIPVDAFGKPVRRGAGFIVQSIRSLNLDNDGKDMDEEDEADEEEQQQGEGGRGGGDEDEGDTSYRSTGSEVLLDDGDTHQRRMEKREQREQRIIHDRQANMLFTPSIKELPKMYWRHRGEKESFVSRSMKWVDTKKQNQSRLQDAYSKDDMSACTFQPEISEMTKAMVSMDSEQRRLLFTQRSATRAKIMELEVRRKAEEQFRDVCTFKPALNKKSMKILSSPGVSVSAGSQHRLNQPKVTPMPLQTEHDYRPKTNKVKPAMEAANLYLEQNAFERLSTPAWKDDAKDSKASNTIKSPKKEAESKDGAKPALTKELLNKITPTFQGFLGRVEGKQKYLDEKKKQQLMQEEEARQKDMCVKASSTSEKMLKNSQFMPQDFNERLAQSAHAKLLVSDIAQRKFVKEDDLTFKPSINPVSKKREPRPVEEMSQGDLLLQMDKRQSLRMEKEKLEAEELTLRPKLNRNRPAEGHLKLNSDKDSLLTRYQDLQKKRQELSQFYHTLKEEEEMAECTFKPVVKNVPQWVKQQAAYMKVKRQMEEQTKKPKKEKPQWL